MQILAHGVHHVKAPFILHARKDKGRKKQESETRKEKNKMISMCEQTETEKLQVV